MKALPRSSQELLAKPHVMQRRDKSKVKKPVFSYFFCVFDTDKRVFTRVFLSEKHIKYRTETSMSRLSREYLVRGSVNQSKNSRVQGCHFLDQVLFIGYGLNWLLMLAFVGA